MNPLSSPQPSLFDRLNQWLRTSTLIKLATIGILILVLLIPTTMLQTLISERESTRNTAVAEVSGKWGGVQTISGPILSVPYTVVEKDEKGKESRYTAYAHVLPDDLRITGTLQPEQRNRGLFQVMLYNTRLLLRGTLPRPDMERLGIDPAAVQWNRAFVSVGISDMKGIKDEVQLRVSSGGGALQPLTVEPGVPTDDVLASGINARVPLGDSLRFDCELNLNGSTDLYFMPFGKQTTVSLTSPWATPSFVGASLPDQRTVSASGFGAQWKVLQYNRNYPQQGLGAFLTHRSPSEEGVTVSAAVGTEFGVRLLTPVDEYQKTMRSAKYAVMFILITFTAFFFVEVLDKRRIHPIQYLLVGFAICLFYLLLLAISEHMSFNLAYFISAATVLAMITFYVRYVFENTRLTALFSGILALLYGFYFSLLQLEDYSLLLGTLGLALILGTIMYLTRRINWYQAYA
ncbi:Inner membrane protein creD [Fibrella aestuarina BUZ 2]|uniref:Inner membrane protein creD n=1 Tax=Fibrella aestuarina BUZ 2 TaxID=1166018 RepID=I0KDP1_9BACT|nr:cell envelope integrity protein CreD [Fibrella aestuarina]CCH02244.1 Inner membrane protein creD [Fibrella aestuarina BUZ 2]